MFIYFSAACRGKKSPLPGMTTGKPYHTLVGDPDLSWYLGLDPDVKQEDIDQGDCKASTVEVNDIKYVHICFTIRYILLTLHYHMAV